MYVCMYVSILVKQALQAEMSVIRKEKDEADNLIISLRRDLDRAKRDATEARVS